MLNVRVGGDLCATRFKFCADSRLYCTLCQTCWVVECFDHPMNCARIGPPPPLRWATSGVSCNGAIVSGVSCPNRPIPVRGAGGVEIEFYPSGDVTHRCLPSSQNPLCCCRLVGAFAWIAMISRTPLYRRQLRPKNSNPFPIPSPIHASKGHDYRCAYFGSNLSMYVFWAIFPKD